MPIVDTETHFWGPFLDSDDHPTRAMASAAIGFAARDAKAHLPPGTDPAHLAQATISFVLQSVLIASLDAGLVEDAESFGLAIPAAIGSAIAAFVTGAGATEVAPEDADQMFAAIRAAFDQYLAQAREHGPAEPVQD